VGEGPRETKKPAVGGCSRALFDPSALQTLVSKFHTPSQKTVGLVNIEMPIPMLATPAALNRNGKTAVPGRGRAGIASSILVGARSKEYNLDCGNLKIPGEAKEMAFGTKRA
jgi:hypothetical protein